MLLPVRPSKRAALQVCEQHDTVGAREIFNVGVTEQNFQKKQIGEMIQVLRLAVALPPLQLQPLYASSCLCDTCCARLVCHKPKSYSISKLSTRGQSVTLCQPQPHSLPVSQRLVARQPVNLSVSQSLSLTLTLTLTHYHLYLLL